MQTVIDTPLKHIIYKKDGTRERGQEKPIKEKVKQNILANRMTKRNFHNANV